MARLLLRSSGWMLLALVGGHPPTEAMEQVPMGPRALGMGGAFTSIADDATAIFWNPAGLSQLDRQEIAGSHADLYQSGTTDDYVAFVAPIMPGFAAAADWYRSGFDDDELDFSENRLDVASGVRVHKVLMLGATVKYISRSVDLDGSAVREGDGFGADFGILVKPVPRVSLGVLGQDVFGTSLEYSGVGSSQVYGRAWRGGVSYAIPRLGVLAMDVDDRYHLGIELRPLSLVALRAGVEDDREGAERMTSSFGVGVRVGAFRFDYALVDHPVLGSTGHFGLSAAFNFNPAQVRIEKVEPNPIYLSLYRSYAHEPLGSVRLRNLQDHPIEARMTVHIPELMRGPSEEEIVLRPNSVQEVPLTAVLSDRVMELDTDRIVPIDVSVTYQSQRLLRTERRTARATALAPGAINWSAGVAQAAAFVTTQDPIVDSFAREAVRSVIFSREGDLFGNRNISFAAAIVDALSVLGMAYVPDPNQPYSKGAGSSNGIDMIQYPRQTLARRTGDCDDSSVLVASLLSHVGVKSKFVDVPGHIFLVVGTGIQGRNRFSLGLNEELHVVSEDEVWIPIETTALDQGFAEAWRRGAEQYANRASLGRLTLIDVTQSQSVYEPAKPREIGFATPEVESKALNASLARDARTVDSWRKQYVASRYGQAIRRTIGVSPEALNELAHVYFTTGQLRETRLRLETLLAQDPTSARARNNLAVTDVAEGDLLGAEKHLEAALASDNSDPGIWLNLGLTRQLHGDTLGAEAAFKQGIARAGSVAASAALLGLSTSADALGQVTDPGTAHRALLLALGEEISTRVGAVSQEQLPGSAQAGAPAEKRDALPAPAIAGSAVKELLYWKE